MNKYALLKKFSLVKRVSFETLDELLAFFIYLSFILSLSETSSTTASTHPNICHLHFFFSFSIQMTAAQRL